jgi:DNA-binding beta-propeller fold protein YncE
MRHLDGSRRSATWLRVAASILAAVVLLFAQAQPALATLVSVAQIPYPDTFVPGFGRAVDETTNRFYVAGDLKIRVIDGVTNTTSSTIPVPGQPWGLAFNPLTHLLYTGSFSAAQIYVIDTISEALVATITLDRRPLGIAVNPATNRVYATTRDSLQVIDGASNAVLQVVELGLETWQVVVNPTTNRIYVNNRLTATLTVIDGETNSVTKTLQFEDPNANPYFNSWGLAVNPVTNRIYVTDRGLYFGFRGVVVCDGATDTVIAKVPTGLMLDVAVSSATGRVYVAGETGLTVINGTTNTVVSAGLVGSSSVVAVNSTANRVYVVRSPNYTYAVVLKEAAVVGMPSLTPNPARSSVGVRVSATLQEDVPAAVAAEYFVGTDPGEGSGASMQVAAGSLTAVIASALPEGTYGVGVRARDLAGGWGPVAWARLVIDTSPPTIGVLSLSLNPKATGESSVLTAIATDALSGVSRGEYFIGADPGEGHASPVTLSGSTLVATIGTAIAPGVYPVGVRAQDGAGNWSATASTYLVVYDPAGGFATGAGSIVPGGSSSDAADLLPGLDSKSRARFAFLVKYSKGSSTVPSGSLEFRYGVSSQPDCMTPGACGDFQLRSATMDWLVVTTPNSAKFQGTATIDGTSGLFPFRVEARDGDSIGLQDRFVIKVYAPGADANDSRPIYKASGDVQGQVQVQR